MRRPNTGVLLLRSGSRCLHHAGFTSSEIIAEKKKALSGNSSLFNDVETSGSSAEESSPFLSSCSLFAPPAAAPVNTARHQVLPYLSVSRPAAATAAGAVSAPRSSGRGAPGTAKRLAAADACNEVSEEDFYLHVNPVAAAVVASSAVPTDVRLLTTDAATANAEANEGRKARKLAHNLPSAVALVSGVAEEKEEGKVVAPFAAAAAAEAEDRQAAFCSAASSAASAAQMTAKKAMISACANFSEREISTFFNFLGGPTLAAAAAPAAAPALASGAASVSAAALGAAFASAVAQAACTPAAAPAAASAAAASASAAALAAASASAADIPSAHGIIRRSLHVNGAVPSADTRRGMENMSVVAAAAFFATASKKGSFLSAAAGDQRERKGVGGRGGLTAAAVGAGKKRGNPKQSDSLQELSKGTFYGSDASSPKFIATQLIVLLSAFYFLFSLLCFAAFGVYLFGEESLDDDDLTAFSPAAAASKTFYTAAGRPPLLRSPIGKEEEESAPALPASRLLPFSLRGRRDSPFLLPPSQLPAAAAQSLFAADAAAAADSAAIAAEIELLAAAEASGATVTGSSRPAAKGRRGGEAEEEGAGQATAGRRGTVGTHAKQQEAPFCSAAAREQPSTAKATAAIDGKGTVREASLVEFALSSVGGTGASAVERGKVEDLGCLKTRGGQTHGECGAVSGLRERRQKKAASPAEQAAPTAAEAETAGAATEAAEPRITASEGGGREHLGEKEKKRTAGRKAILIFNAEAYQWATVDGRMLLIAFFTSSVAM